MKCIQCGEEIPELGGILVSMDGDFVCSHVCRKAMENQQDLIAAMSDKQFEHWMAH